MILVKRGTAKIMVGDRVLDEMRFYVFGVRWVGCVMLCHIGGKWRLSVYRAVNEK